MHCCRLRPYQCCKPSELHQQCSPFPRLAVPPACNLPQLCKRTEFYVRPSELAAHAMAQQEARKRFQGWGQAKAEAAATAAPATGTSATRTRSEVPGSANGDGESVCMEHAGCCQHELIVSVYSSLVFSMRISQ